MYRGEGKRKEGRKEGSEGVEGGREGEERCIDDVGSSRGRGCWGRVWSPVPPPPPPLFSLTPHIPPRPHQRA